MKAKKMGLEAKSRRHNRNRSFGVSRETNLSKVSRRQGMLIERVNRMELRPAQVRISLYDIKGDYRGWIGKKDFRALKRDSQGGVMVNKAGFAKVKGVTLERVVTYRVPKGTRKASVSIETFTRTQRRLVVAKFRKRVLPVPVKRGVSPFTRLKFSMDKVFGRLGFGIIKIKRGS